MTDNGGTNLFNIKRGVLDQGFRGEDPYKKSDLFKIHKKHFTSTSGSDFTLYLCQRGNLS